MKTHADQDNIHKLVCFSAAVEIVLKALWDNLHSIRFRSLRMRCSSSCFHKQFPIMISFVQSVGLLLLPLSFNAMTAITIIIINLENQNEPRARETKKQRQTQLLCDIRGTVPCQDRTC